MRRNAVVSAGTGGAGPSYMKLWDCMTTMECDITESESAASSIGHINFQMKLTEKA